MSILNCCHPTSQGHSNAEGPQGVLASLLLAVASAVRSVVPSAVPSVVPVELNSGGPCVLFLV